MTFIVRNIGVVGSGAIGCDGSIGIAGMMGVAGSSDDHGCVGVGIVGIDGCCGATGNSGAGVGSTGFINCRASCAAIASRHR